MSENTNLEGLSRRDFIKLAGAAIVGPSLPRKPEVVSAHKLKLAALRVDSRPFFDRPSKDLAYHILGQIKDVLEKERPNLVVTPEFSFEIYDDENPQVLNYCSLVKKARDLFEVHESSHPFTNK